MFKMIYFRMIGYQNLKLLKSHKFLLKTKLRILLNIKQYKERIQFNSFIIVRIKMYLIYN